MTNRDDNEPIRSNPGDFWQKKGEELREMFAEKEYTEKEFEALRAESQAKDTRIKELEDIACGFAEWIDKSYKNYANHGEFGWSKKFPYQNTMLSISTKKLLEEYKKQLTK